MTPQRWLCAALLLLASACHREPSGLRCRWAPRTLPDGFVAGFDRCTDQQTREVVCRSLAGEPGISVPPWQCACTLGGVVGASFRVENSRDLVSSPTSALAVANQQCGWRAALAK